MDAFDLVVYMMTSRTDRPNGHDSSPITADIQWQHITDLRAVSEASRYRLEIEMSKVGLSVSDKDGTQYRFTGRYDIEELTGLVLARANRELVAFCGYQLWRVARSYVLYIDTMGVLPGYQGRGY